MARDNYSYKKNQKELKKKKKQQEKLQRKLDRKNLQAQAGSDQALAGGTISEPAGPAQDPQGGSL